MRVVRIVLLYVVAVLLISPVNAAEAEPDGFVALTSEFVRNHEGASAVILLALVFLVSWGAIRINSKFNPSPFHDE